MKFNLPLLALLFPLALSACAAPDTDQPTTTQGEWNFRDIGGGEAAVIAASHDRARRESSVLILGLANGKTRIFQNESGACESEDSVEGCNHFILVEDLPAFHWYFVVENIYEGANFLLIDDRNGLPTEISYWPVFSPDGQRFLIQNDDMSGFFSGDNLEIWRRQGTRAVREWAANPDAGDTGVSKGGPPYHSAVQSWQGDRIALTFSVPGAYDLKTRTSAPGRAWPATLMHQADGWHLDARAPKE